MRKDGDTVDQDVFSFMTTTPNDLVTTVNHERMPVLLTTEADQDRWMTGTSDDAFTLAQPYAADAMRIVREGFAKADG